MTALPFLKSMTRLHGLLAVALVLAGVAAASNYVYWRRASAQRAAAASARPAVNPREAPSPWAGEIRELRRQLEQFPGDTAARFRLAEVYFVAKEYPRALVELEVLRHAQPENAEVYLRRAMVQKYTGRLAEAEKSVRRALALRPQDATAREWLGEIYLGQGRFDEALAVFNQCLKRRPESYFALMGKARALEQRFIARYPVGLSEMTAPVEKAVQLEPNNPWGVVTLARMTLNYLVRPDAAEKLALRAAELNPTDVEPYILLAEITLQRPPTPQNLRQAGLYALEAARRDPEDWRPSYELGRALLKQNEPAEAAKLLEQSVKMQAMPEAVYQLSLAYARAGNAERAKHYGGIYQQWTELMERRKALLADIQREPREVGHYYRLAELYLQADAPAPAENWLRRARVLRPKDARGERLMAQVRRLRGTGSDAPLLAVP